MFAHQISLFKSSLWIKYGLSNVEYLAAIWEKYDGLLLQLPQLEDVDRAAFIRVGPFCFSEISLGVVLCAQTPVVDVSVSVLVRGFMLARIGNGIT